jgi:hypothetical protein
MVKLDYTLYIKLILILYILFIFLRIILSTYLKLAPYGTNKYTNYLVSNKIIKITFLLLILIASFYDITISLLLTVILIINIIIYNTPIAEGIEIYQKKNTPYIDIKEKFLNEPEELEIMPIEKSTLPTSQNEKPLLTDNDDIIYKKNIHISLDNLLPDTSKMDNMQNNLFNKEASFDISPLKEQYDHQGIGIISGYDEISYYPLI